MNLFVLPALYLRFGRPSDNGRDWHGEPTIKRAPTPTAPPRDRVGEILTVMRETPSDAPA